METTDWLELENTQSLIKFIKEKIQELGIQSLSGHFADPTNADITQYWEGRTNGLFEAYKEVMDKMGQELESPEDLSEEYDA